ncbi:MAG: hypothetical protein IPK13_23110 [Deltaproteobacteria bacterium]|nr:hypothetical protein [Deltaproteobacteria bacterium]
MIRWHRTLTPVWMGAFILAVSSSAMARDEKDCQRTWARAVRSYLTQNRKAGPDGKMPADLDQAELAAQAWEQAFSPACQLEASGKRSEARVEAAMIGAQLLAKLDPRGCARFMDSYMQSSRSKDVCDSARSSSTEQVRSMISDSIPAR